MVCTPMVQNNRFQINGCGTVHGLSLQKDDRAFVKYNASTGNYDEGGPGSHLDGFAEYKKGWRHTYYVL